MNVTARLLVTSLTLVFATAAMGVAETKDQLTRKLWPRQRIVEALAEIEKLRAAGMMSESHYRRKKEMLQARLAGTFTPAMLSATNPPLNFIQNSSFEEINRNSQRNRSRWLWWGGWSWGGDYENHWEGRPEYVRSGKYSARIKCLGKKGRIGVSTPKLPIVPGATEYEFSVWAKGEGDNRLFLNFEAGAKGTFSRTHRTRVAAGRAEGHARARRRQLHGLRLRDRGRNDLVGRHKVSTDRRATG